MTKPRTGSLSFYNQFYVKQQNTEQEGIRRFGKVLAFVQRCEAAQV